MENFNYLEDLGKGKSSVSAKKTRPPSSRVDLNELENLMEDLAAPTWRSIPGKKHHHSVLHRIFTFNGLP